MQDFMNNFENERQQQINQINKLEHNIIEQLEYQSKIVALMKQFPTASDFNENAFENKSKVKSDNPEQNLK